jgi:hypothetical protein
MPAATNCGAATAHFFAGSFPIKANNLLLPVAGVELVSCVLFQEKRQVGRIRKVHQSRLTIGQKRFESVEAGACL